MIVVRVNGIDYLVERPAIKISASSPKVKEFLVGGELVDGSYESMVLFETELSRYNATVTILGRYRISVKQYTVWISSTGKVLFEISGFEVGQAGQASLLKTRGV